ncbi:DUF3043 domain-containing protein [Aeromicrobium sp. A1-2]|uniref:DUF3043 domain-containing protein n=1 Tax=Aeromicrobium sp. A1-2 TaxID=2107713 RepID=UPI0013C306B6|nr:DUF3043 domain-containing protein [Aeromicrobium sp. A1-2]
MVDETESGKGRATPSRKQAEAARKKQMKVPVSRKDQVKRERAAREELRLKQREALKTGDEKFLPARERGPVRKFCRDYVDRRWNFAEFLLIFLVLILLLSIVGAGAQWSAAATFVLYPFVIIGTVLDEIILVRGLRKQLKARFDPDEIGGSIAYTVLRSTQLRRFRLPKPQLKRGEALASRY